jgi:hypothetical protein
MSGGFFQPSLAPAEANIGKIGGASAAAFRMRRSGNIFAAAVELIRFPR